MLFAGGESNVFEAVTHLVFQLGVILIMAKLGGEVFTRFLKLPAVIGELLIGVAIGPYALGNYINLGKIIPGSGLGTLFPKPDIPTEAISLELFSISEIAVIVLLFFVGLETNLGQFMRYAKPGSVIALGGVIVPFILGVVATIMFVDYADGIGSAEALFMGAAMTATSVGITARVLSERKKLATPEGVTILAAAVIDDILGILILTLACGRGRYRCSLSHRHTDRRREGSGFSGRLVRGRIAGIQVFIEIHTVAEGNRSGDRDCARARAAILGAR